MKTKEKNSKGKPQAEWIQKTLPFIFNHVKMSFILRGKKPTKLQPVTKVRLSFYYITRVWQAKNWCNTNMQTATKIRSCTSPIQVFISVIIIDDKEDSENDNDDKEA